MYRKRISSFLICLCFAAGLMASQGTGGADTAKGDLQLLRQQWDKKSGLPDWKVITFMQDRRGLMWIAFNTKDELFTFDGYRFRAVKSANAPGKGSITRLAEDIHGNIWMVRVSGSTATIDVLDPAAETVRPLHRYLSLPNPVKITALRDRLFVYNIAGHIWIGSHEAVYRYDGAWKKVFTSAGDPMEEWFPAKEELCWYQKENAICLGDSRGGVLDSFYREGFDLRYIWLDSGLDLWAAYSQPGQMAIDHYCRLSSRRGAIAVYQTRDIPKTDWVNDQDIFTRPPHRSKFIAHGLLATQTPEGWFLGLPRAPLLLNLSRLYPDSDDMGAFYFDRSGGIWSNNTHGLSRFALRSAKSPFRTLLTSSSRPYSMRGIAQKDGVLYALSYSGSRRIELATGKASSMAYPGDWLGYALLSEGDTIWIGTHEQVVALQPGAGPKLYPLRGGPLPTFALYRSPTTGLLAGTKNGLFRLDPRSGIFEQTPFSAREIYAFHENPDGLWVGTSNGLFLLDSQFRVKRQALKTGPRSGDIRVQYLYEDLDGQFWIATRGDGLLHWNPKTGQLDQYHTRNGLPHDNVHAVYPDQYGFLWLPSDRGLVRFQKTSGFIQTFYKNDGLADDEFNLSSHFQGKDGTLFFGGINGITFFHPKDVPAYTGNQQPLHLVEAHSFNLKSGTSQVQVKNAAHMRTLLLRPRDTYLDLNVSPLLYQAGSAVQYAWKFENFRQDWVVQASPRIRLYNLPYGTHTLQVRYHSPGDTWPGPTLRLQVQVLRPFFLRWPFFLLVAIGIAVIALSYSYWKNRQLSTAKSSLEAEVQRRTRQIEENIQVISRQAEELRSFYGLKSRFFANVTHELRTPLTLIIGPVERLLQGASLPVKASESLLIVQQNAQKLLTLVEELLDLSKMESQKLALEERPLHLYTFVSRLFRSFAPYAEHRKVRLNLHYDCPYDLTLLTDAPKLEKIISNLLSNALKFTPSQGKIILTISQEGESLRIRVEDTGHGIPPEDLPYIFDRYFQSKRSDAPLQGGTGIGLSLSREYARLFGGELNVESRVGEGSVFTFFFPVKSPSSASYLYDDSNARGLVLLPGAKPSLLPAKAHTLLIVEDDYNLAQYIQGVLESEYNIVITDNGVNALHQLRQYPFDLILSDIMMPEMDGFQLLEAVQAQGLDIPFVLLTSLTARNIRMSALRMGVDDYLTKPFLEEELRVRLRNLLKRQAVRKATKPEQGDEEEYATSYDQKWIARLEAVLHENISDPEFTITQMAAYMNTSLRSLQYKTKLYTGLNPVNYLTEFRLNQARQLLEAHVYQTVTEVSYAVGFKTPRYFAQLIRERYGKSPSEF